MTEEKGVIVASQEVLEDVFEFIKENIVEVKVEVKQKQLMKQAKKMLADGLRKIAEFIEDPTKEITWIDFKKNKD